MKKTTAIVSCAVLGLVAFTAGRFSSGSNSGSHAASRHVLYYVDSMHPSYRSDKPGIAPDCGMELTPVYEGENLFSKLELPDGAVSISPEKQKMIGVRVEEAEKDAGTHTIRTTGKVEAEENRLYRLTAATEGWVQSLENNPAGTLVKKNQLLASFYSREFRNAQQAYLGALSSNERVKMSNMPDDANSILRTNEEALRALGMGDPQIKELAKKRQTTRDISVTSPADGIVLARNISPEQRFDKGAELYRIADLTKVWIIADVYGDQSAALRPGSKVKVTVRELGKTVYATVTANPPLFDPESRTLKLRLEADNPSLALRPDMFVDLSFNVTAPAGLSIPAEAVLDTGTKKIVYVQVADDIFEPRAVELGASYADRVTITHGLAKGEKVVSAGTFLVDSESRIRTKPAHPIATAGASSPSGMAGHESHP